MNPKTIIISRTDSIGDVVLTLPMAGILKEKFPNCKVLFLGKTYTRPIVDTCIYVDGFIDWNILQKETNPVKLLRSYKSDVFIHVFPNKLLATLALKAKIPIRIGTRGRIYHILTCNKKVAFSRRKSLFHEAQLNLKLLSPLGINKAFSLLDIEQAYGLKPTKKLSPFLTNLLDTQKTKLILHPKSKGSAKEWGLDKYAELIKILPEEKFRIFITGTEEEGLLIGDALPYKKRNVESLIGKLSLDELINFISNVDALVAASTGPLHIAAAFGANAIGLFSSEKPIHPGRWKPIGKNAKAIVFDEECEACKTGKNCSCISKIPPQKICDILIKQ